MTTKTTQSESAKSVSEDMKDDGQSSLYQQILTKLEEKKKSNGSKYENHLLAINRMTSRLDTLETEHNEFLDCMEFMSKEIHEVRDENQELQKNIAEL